MINKHFIRLFSCISKWCSREIEVSTLSYHAFVRSVWQISEILNQGLFAIFPRGHFMSKSWTFKSAAGRLETEMSWLDAFVSNTQQEVVEELQHLVDEKGIKEKVLEDAQELAKIAARHILDETQPELQAFPSVPIDGDKELQYLLVLEFLQSAGFKFAPSVLRFESQHPEIELNRRELGKQLNLCTYDRTPYLVQLIEEQLKTLEE